MIKALLSMGLLIGVVACGGATGLKVSQEDFGDEWPFTVPDGELGCEEGAAYTFTHDGTVYALNGMADTWAEVFGYADLDPIWKPRTKPLAPGVPAPSYMRMDVSEMFRLAGEQCEETPATGLKVSQEDFGDDWPFTVPDGTLKCWPELTEGTLAEEGLGWYTFEHGGTTYALNSVLLGTVNGFQGWSDIQLIWKQDLRTTTPGAPNPNIRVNISEMVGLAMKQCS